MATDFHQLVAMAADDLPWTPLTGVPGLHVVTLSDDLDESSGTGSRTRMVRFDPGARTDVILSHSYWEEVLCLAGELNESANSPTGSAIFIRRPPQTAHGPFYSPTGCLLVEFQFFRGADPSS